MRRPVQQNEKVMNYLKLGRQNQDEPTGICKEQIMLKLPHFLQQHGIQLCG